jgi:hypothetical protein
MKKNLRRRFFHWLGILNKWFFQGIGYGLNLRYWIWISSVKLQISIKEFVVAHNKFL